MKVCENCGIEIGTSDGDNLCRACELLDDKRDGKSLARKRSRERKRQVEAMLRSFGMTKVKGARNGD